jgi:DNA-directed RNA polymerase specialized sigma24 family protein
MKKIKIYKINGTKARLSDEEIDPIEQDDFDSHPEILTEGWLPWSVEDIADIKRLIATRLPDKQREILEAFLEGKTHKEIDVTEKYWRWHFAKGIEFIKKELKI